MPATTAAGGLSAWPMAALTVRVSAEKSRIGNFGMLRLYARRFTSWAGQTKSGNHRIVLMIPKLCVLLGCAALTCAAQSQKVFPYEYSQEDLPNGLRLITVPTDYANIVATYIVVQTGSRNEVEPGHTGFAHLFEHLMFRGTEKFPPAKYNEALNRIGASSNASTSDDLTVYHTTFSKEDLDGVLAMEADRFQHLKYAEPEFKTESLAVLGGYNKNSASPFSKLNEVLHDTAYDKHTYKHTTMGFLKDIQDMPNQYEYSR